MGSRSCNPLEEKVKNSCRRLSSSAKRRKRRAMPASLPARPLTQPYRFRKICRTGFLWRNRRNGPTAGSAGNQIAKFFQIQIKLTLNTEKGPFSGSFFCVKTGCFCSRRLSHACFLYLCRSAKIPETTMRLSFSALQIFSAALLILLPAARTWVVSADLRLFTTVLERR